MNNGILQNAQQAPTQQVPGQQVPAQQAPIEEPVEGNQGSLDEQATPEEQEAYERVVLSATKIIFDEGQIQQGVIKQLKTGKQNPAQAIADVSSMIITQLDQQSGGQIPETVILPAAIEVVEQVTELSSSMNIFPVDEAVMNHAAQLMVVKLGEEYGVEQADIEGIMQSTPTDQLKQIETQQGEYARKQPNKEVLERGPNG